jgi:hypothetical protein
MSKDIDFNIKDLPKEFARLGHTVSPFIPVIFFVLIATVYGVILLRITTLSSAAPDPNTVSTQVTELTPHIDTSSIKQLQSLEDNNVNVQTLFNDARGNPFGE